MDTPIIKSRARYQERTKEKYINFLSAIKKNYTSDNPVSMRDIISNHKVSDQNRWALFDSKILLKDGDNLIWNGGMIDDSLLIEFHNATLMRGYLNKIKTLSNKLNVANYQLILAKSVAKIEDKKRKKKEKKSKKKNKK